jgi:uncharacterized membrane protein YoaK (UPF0700 family)
MLAVSAGSADGWSYLGLGHAFVANMTGNTVLLGIAVFQKEGDLLHPLVALLSYAAGAGIGSSLTRKVRPEAVWTRDISYALLVEGLLLAMAQIGWALFQGGSFPAASEPTVRNVLLAFVALAVGLQSGAILQLQIPGIVTTYITGTWTNLINGLVRSRNIAPEARNEKPKFEERLLMQAGILLSYFLSAVLTGWIFRYTTQGVGLLPAVSVLLVAGYGILHSTQER